MNVEQVTTLLAAYLLWGLRGAVLVGFILSFIRALSKVLDDREKKSR